MRLFRKTHQQKGSINSISEYLGKTKEELIQLLPENSTFILDSWYLHTIGVADIRSWIVVNGKCTSYLRGDFNGNILESISTNTTIATVHEHWMEKQKPELLKIVSK